MKNVFGGNTKVHFLCHIKSGEGLGPLAGLIDNAKYILQEVAVNNSDTIKDSHIGEILKMMEAFRYVEFKYFFSLFVFVFG